MKIALVCKKYSLKEGGLERYTVTLSRELLRAGHDVHILANRWQDEPGVTFHRVPVVRLSSPIKNLSFAFFAGRILSKIKADISQSMERISYQDIFRASDGINPVQLMQRYTNPAVRRFKAIGPRRLALSYLEHKIFLGGGCKVVMALSQLVKGQIIEHYKMDPGRIEVIYNGVDTGRFNPMVKDRYREPLRKKHGIGEDDTLLLFISNDHKRKGLQTILQAMLLSGKEDIRLMIVGSDSAKPYQRFAVENRLDKQVLFLGPQTDIERYYGAADIFVLPTRYDAFGSVFLEAMACGLPIITTTNSGASELVQEGKDGFILKTREPDELAKRINELLSFPSLRISMGKLAAEKAKNYTIGKHVSKVLELYERVRAGRYD
jgi:UDP-glucose:(heptosyl)LPS alpha-1,3-glucosyltransferase